MKKNRMMRLASGLLVAVLATTSMISGTYAKYTTKITGTDKARVAKFGVELNVQSDLFKAQYAGNDAISVLADDGKDVIAPGTTGDALTFEINGTPEVDVRVIVSLSGVSSDSADDLTMVTLPAGDYKDWTNLNVAEKVTVAEYKPVKWTLAKDGAAVVGYEDVALSEIETYLTTLSTEYDVESDAFTSINGVYTISWNWEFETGHDLEDTILGQIAAGVETAPSGHQAYETFNFTITVEQID